MTFIPKQINNPYFDAAKQGADKAASELGGTVTQVGPSAATEAQASFIQDETTKGVSAIAISANDPNAVVPALQAAKAAGIKIVGYDMSKEAARRAYEEAGVGPEDVDVIELHDCFSANELVTYEALGLAEEGCAHELVEAEDTTYGGRWVVNPSGGLISKGHPLGATGLAQCSELTWQLRGQADARQVDGAKVALQHNIGLGGAAVVSVYKPASA